MCWKKSVLGTCSNCLVVSSCSPAHQALHEDEGEMCAKIKTTREALERRVKAARQANPGIGPQEFQMLIPPSVALDHNPSASVLGPGEAAAVALMHVGTSQAAETALEYLLEILQSRRSSSLSADAVPALLLRMGMEQECYDFIKWFATLERERYDWENKNLPFLDIRFADVFEPVGVFCKGTDVTLSHLAVLALLKLRIRFDLEAGKAADRRPGITARAMLRVWNRHQQYHTLFQAIQDRNPYFWEELLDEMKEDPRLPASYSCGSELEARESEGALGTVKSDILTTVSVYQTPATVSPSSTSERNGSSAGGTLIKRRGTGKVFPSRFIPDSATHSPADLFAGSRASPSGDVYRFVAINDPNTCLAFVDGACLNNGQPDARAGVFDDGDYHIATSNRAELRAAIAALRLCNWRLEGWDRLLIATDSTYVADGAISWAKSWVRRGWTTRASKKVENRDLWEMLLGEVERWKELGLQVAIWKDAAGRGAVQDRFRDITIRYGVTPTGGVARVGGDLILHLGEDRVIKQAFPNAYAQIRSSLPNAKYVTTYHDALTLLDSTPSPRRILLADATVSRCKKLWERVIDRLRGGAAVVLAGFFSCNLSQSDFDRMFIKLGLPWRYRTHDHDMFTLGAGMAVGLQKSYSMYAQCISVISTNQALYRSDYLPGEAAVATAKVGAGRLAYIGDASGEEGTGAVLKAIFQGEF
ncbi:uncharacterized protein C8A04DRAFT_34041 [Dichotomopilus funicola]|uniref:RNase H type-1 domain-containing protein n=1 Tax=Dichotomopilus funicola TaxID=1934379 RepID=A0AAN6ZR80_9PEZI|nr:hypothetical protein C8A04DRAFT_34041 [Dichotomopilus funicola]